MAFEQIRMDRPLSRLELAVVVLLIASCFTWFLNRMNYMTALAEATALDLTVRNLKAGVMSAVASGMLRNDAQALQRIAESNPVGSAIDPPAGYIGAVRGANPASIQPGQWYYDEDNHWLVYHVVNADYFLGAGEGPARVRIQLRLNYNDVNENGSFDAGSDVPGSVSVMMLDEFAWRL
jgi:hypothetical protein